jgi:hypothetical protein
MDHPEFATKRGHTSKVLSETPVEEGIEIETLNSRYLLVGAEITLTEVRSASESRELP